MNLTKVKYYIRLFLGKHPFVRRDIKLPFERFGTDYGGWNIASGSVHKGSIVYSIGIGEDISFDLGLMARYQCPIFAYDPTPKVVKWLKTQKIPPEFIFTPAGLAPQDGFVEFFSPENPDHVSHSARPSQNMKGKALHFEVKSLATMMRENNHTHIDLIKMDIEGFEYDVINHIVSEKLDIHQLLVEFHHGMYSFANEDTLKAIATLRKAGYKLFAISDSGREYSFCR